MRKLLFVIGLAVITLPILLIIVLWFVSDDIYSDSECISSMYDEEAVASTQYAANAIADAIVLYYRDHNRFPSRLDELVPEYISIVGNPDAGDRWYYQLQPANNAATFGFGCMSIKGFHPGYYVIIDGDNLEGRQWSASL